MPRPLQALTAAATMMVAIRTATVEARIDRMIY
jgi:hypothetical protein